LTSSATISFVDFSFCREADENCALLGYYTVSSGNNPEKRSSDNFWS